MKLVTIDLDQKISWQEYDPEHEDYNDVGGSLEDFLSFADGIKGIPAVPLDKLCEWLGKVAILRCCECTSNYCDGKECSSSNHFDKEIKKWMEEQDAAD